jgi:hypothetical protein
VLIEFESLDSGKELCSKTDVCSFSLSHACDAKRSCGAGQTIECTKVFGGWQAVIEGTLHFPAPEIKLPPRSTAQTTPICLTLTGKRPTHLSVPTTKQASYPAADSREKRK